MDHENDILSTVKSNICRHFSIKCPFKKCRLVSNHTSHLNSAGDLSFPVDIKAWRGHVLTGTEQAKRPLSGGDGCHLDHDVIKGREITSVLERLSRKLKEKCSCSSAVGDTEKDHDIVISDLIELSRSWPLVLRRCSLQKARFVMYLDRTLTFKTALHIILSQGCSFGCGAKKSQGFLITSDPADEDMEALDLTQYRVRVVKEVFSNVLTSSGYEPLSEEDNEKDHVHFHVTSRHPSNLPSSSVRVLCGVVLNRKLGTKEKDVLVRDYLRLRSKDVETRLGSDTVVDSGDSERLKLTSAGLRAEVLAVRPGQPVSLDLQPGEGSNKAVPILYTCARIAVLRNRYEELVSEGVYPPLVPLEEVDFSLLVKEEEWQLLFGCLLVFPSLVQECVEHMKTAQPQPHLLFQFLVDLSRHYSVYYSYVRILVKPEKQVLNTIFARLYLLQAIEYVLHNALNILGIEPVSRM